MNLPTSLAYTQTHAYKSLLQSNLITSQAYTGTCLPVWLTREPANQLSYTHMIFRISQAFTGGQAFTGTCISVVVVVVVDVVVVGQTVGSISSKTLAYDCWPIHADT